MHNILVTNDDGIQAEGLRKLVRSLSMLSNVYVVAPASQQSGMGQSMTAMRTFTATEVEVKGAERAFEVDGTPADCVKYGLQTLNAEGIQIDFVFSGINMGANLGSDVHYSGTVGAAMEGAMYGIHSVALSVASHEPDNYEYICNMIPNLIDLSKELETTVVLNVNAPDLPLWKIRGVRMTESGARSFKDTIVPVEGSENTYEYTGGRVSLEGVAPQKDLVAHRDGYATITPLRIDYTDLSALYRIRRTTNAEALCLFIDYQEKLVPAMRKQKDLIRNASKWAKCADRLGLPILLTQQYTSGLGPTVEEIRTAAGQYERLEKVSFSCFDAPGFEEKVNALTSRSVVIAGIESHICVLQTALGFLERGFDVTVLKDCCGSRNKVDHESAMHELEMKGARVTTFETYVYQLMGSSNHTAFRAITKIVKE